MNFPTSTPRDAPEYGHAKMQPAMPGGERMAFALHGAAARDELQVLYHYPFNKVKIVQSFVHGIGRHHADEVIVNVIVAMPIPIIGVDGEVAHLAPWIAQDFSIPAYLLRLLNASCYGNFEQ